MSGELERSINLRDMTLLVVSLVIGSGIFLVPGAVIRAVEGNVSAALLVWLLAGVLSFLGALTYGELGAMKPEAGGLYVFLRDAFGSLTAFLFGWTLFFVIGPGATATLAVAFANYLNEVVTLSPVMLKVVALVVIGVIVAVNVRGTRGSVSVQRYSTAIKAGALLVMALMLIFRGEHLATPGLFAFPGMSLSFLSAMGIAMISVLWAYEGWQWATFSAGETSDPQRTFPLGMAFGTLILVALYCIANVGYIAALGAEGAAASDSIAAAAVGTVFGENAKRLIAFAILVAIFSAANGTVLTGSRVFFAMSRDGVFFKPFARVHHRFATPAVSVIAHGSWAMVLAATGTFQTLLTYVVFTGWLFYARGAAEDEWIVRGDRRYDGESENR